MKHLPKILIAIIVVISAQLIGVTMASATPGTNDLELSNGSLDYLGQVAQFKVCNNGLETITSIQYDYNLSNLTPNQYIVIPGSESTASDTGSVNATTGLWTGSLESTKCIHYAVFNTVTGAVGQTISGDISIVSSTIQGGATNIDDVSNNDTITETPFTIVNTPDLAATTHLITPGPIHNGDTLSYEVDVTNVGVGADPVNDQFTIAFIIPAAATFQDLVYTGGTQTATPSQACGGNDTSQMGPGLSQHAGYLTFCNFTWGSEFQPGQIAKFVVTMVANQDFESNGVNVVGAISGIDPDSLFIQVDMARGLDPFARTANNFFNLTYNTDALQVTINRCTGQQAVTVNGSGCFNVSFSKKILASSFTVDDLVLSGGGTVSGFTKIDDQNWRVDVAGIQPGSTLALTLGANSVQDLNAINNDVHVLGENTIRYEVATPAGTTSANGTLAKTGIDSSELYGALTFLILGLVLIIQSKRKTKAEVL